ncbi:15740_t:CDS:2, partial [Acaulospora colombiana]
RGTTENMLDDKSFVETYKESIVEAACNMAYEDEYDDTYDTSGLRMRGIELHMVDEPDEGSSSYQKIDASISHENELIKMYLSDSSLLERNKTARNSSARTRLRAATQMTDEQIEGWFIMFKRNPKKDRILEAYEHEQKRNKEEAQSSEPEGTDSRTTKYGGKYTVTLIPGDGIGQETANAVKTIFKAANVPVEWEQLNVTGYTQEDDILFQRSVESLRRNKVALKGILYTPISKMGHQSFNVAMRKGLDIYASLVIIKNIKGYPTRHKDVDFAIIRENTEGEYAGLEHQSYPGVVESLKIVTREKTERIARFAFDFALKNNRKKGHMKLGDGLFLNTCREVAKEYKSSGIEFNDMIVDNCSMQLVSKPQQFDVMVMPNLYGNIVSNVGAALVGGAGIIPGANIGRNYALFEPVREFSMTIRLFRGMRSLNSSHHSFIRDVGMLAKT